MPQDIVRVLRIIEYTGPRDQMEKQIAGSLHGEKKFGQMTIRAATIGEYPEILQTNQKIIQPEDNEPYCSTPDPDREGCYCGLFNNHSGLHEFTRGFWGF